MPGQKALQVYVNGETCDVPEGSNITSLLVLLELPLDRVAVELDKAIVRRRDWNATFVNSGAHLEVVEFVGGG